MTHGCRTGEGGAGDRQITVRKKRKESGHLIGLVCRITITFLHILAVCIGSSVCMFLSWPIADVNIYVASAKAVGRLLPPEAAGRAKKAPHG